MAKKPMNAAKAKFQGRGALDAFLNLLTLITSGWLAWSLGAIVFQTVNKHFSSIIYGRTYFDEGLLKTGIASALIVAPVYYFVMFVLHRKYKSAELNHESGIHRWLTYLMLLVSSLAIIGSLIALIAGFLNGDYTANVVLKIIAVIVIAGAIFGYYFYDLKRTDYSKASLVSLIMGIAAGVILLAAAVIGFLSMTNPALARLQIIDRQTITAANNIYTMIMVDYKSGGELKQVLDLSQLTNSSDPEPYKRVSYRLIDPAHFELCADFLAPAPASQGGYYSNYPEGVFSNHKAGRMCHAYDIRAESASIYGDAAKTNLPPAAVSAAQAGQANQAAQTAQAEKAVR